MWFPNRSDTKRAVLSIEEEIFNLESKMYYSCSEISML